MVVQAELRTCIETVTKFYGPIIAQEQIVSAIKKYLTLALWLNLLSSHLTTAVPGNGMKGFRSMSAEQMSSKLLKTLHTRFSLKDIILAALLRCSSCDQK